MSTPIPPTDVPPPDPGQPQPKTPLPWQMWLAVTLLVGLLAVITIPNLAKPQDTACKSCCLPHLKQTDGAIQLWALENRKSGTALVTSDDILPYLMEGLMPVCPGKGTYVLSTVSSGPRCTQSHYGHSL